MLKKWKLASTITVMVIALTACDGDTTKTESVAPTEPVVTTAATSSDAPTPSVVPTTPTGFGDAQAAVEIYFKMFNAYNAALLDPATAVVDTFAVYLTGATKTAFVQSMEDNKAAGRAFRGTPPIPRPTVAEAKLDGTLPELTLLDCAYSPGVWEEYYIATGQAASSPPAVPLPYEATVKMFQPNRQQWVITSYKTDSSKTCTR